MSAELLQLLLLIIIANGAPIITRQWLSDNFSYAVDLDHGLADSNRIFGPSKTWRGLFSSLFATPAIAVLLGYSIETGLMVAVYAVIGDLLSSFIKRRLSMEASSTAPLLDQVPESFIPAFMMRQTFNLDIFSVLWLVLIFITIELLLSHILYKWGVRKKPY